MKRKTSNINTTSTTTTKQQAHFTNQCGANYVLDNFIFNNSHGIDYTKPSETRTVKVKIGDTTLYVGAPLHIGNNKLDQNVAAFSLSPVITCPTAKKYGCDTDCFGLKSERMYDATKNKNLVYTYLAYNNIKYLKQLIEQDLDKIIKSNEKKQVAASILEKTIAACDNDNLKRELQDDLNTIRASIVNTVRIHETGEFFSRKYIAMWIAIVKKYCNDFTFYTYSKTIELFQTELEKLVNAGCAVVDSVYNGGKNYGPAAWIKEQKANNSAVCVCPSTPENHNHICGHTCRLCMEWTENFKQVLFLQH